MVSDTSDNNFSLFEEDENASEEELMRSQLFDIFNTDKLWKKGFIQTIIADYKNYMYSGGNHFEFFFDAKYSNKYKKTQVTHPFFFSGSTSGDSFSLQPIIIRQKKQKHWRSTDNYKLYQQEYFAIGQCRKDQKAINRLKNQLNEQASKILLSQKYDFPQGTKWLVIDIFTKQQYLFYNEREACIYFNVKPTACTMAARRKFIMLKKYIVIRKPVIEI